MAQMLKKSWRAALMVACLAPFIFTSCIKDDLDGCNPLEGIYINFVYDYNVKQADAFDSEVRNLHVYVFDANGRFVTQKDTAASVFTKEYNMNIAGLDTGRYKIVTLAYDRQVVPEKDNFRISTLLPGKSTEADLHAQLQSTRGENSTQFAALYSGEQTIYLDGKFAFATVPLMKLTNSYRVILMPYTSGDESFVTDNFDIRITGYATWLNWNGSLRQAGPVTYRPYNMGMEVYEGAANDPSPIDKALTFDLCSSRLFYPQPEGQDARLIITDKRNGSVVFNHSLPWLLSLYGGSEKLDSWSILEYLDRQDHYTLMFFFDANYNFYARIKVNDWVVHLSDVGL